MTHLSIYKKLKRLSLLIGTFSVTSFCQANDFATDPQYSSFKQKTMQSYGLTAEQVDWP